MKLKKIMSAIIAAACAAFMGISAAAEDNSVPCNMGEPAAISSEIISETPSASGICVLNILGTENYTYAYQALEILNQYRAEKGLDPLTMDSTLLDAAMQRAAETAVYYSHTRPDGTPCFTAFDGGARAENIAAGYPNVESVMTGWKNSSGHYANMIGSWYKSVGIGCVKVNGILFWTQCFNDGTGDGYEKSGTQNALRAVSADRTMLGISGSLNQNSFSSAGETASFTVKNVNQGWNYVTAVIDNSSFDFSSSAPNTASVDKNGTVTITGGGTAVISAKTKTGSLTLSDTLTSTAPVSVVKPKITKTIIGDGQIGLNWTTSPGASNYAVYYKYNGAWKCAGTRTSTGMYVKGLTNGVKYGFAVKAYVNGAWTSVTSADIVYAAPVSSASKPKITKTIIGNGQIGLNWTAVNGAAQYAVYVYQNGKWTLAGKRTATGMYVKNLKNGVKYGFAVKAYVNGKWTAISSTDIVYATPVAAKASLIGEMTDIVPDLKF